MKRPRNLGWPLVFGLADAGLASLGTFVSGFVAAKYLSPTVLGAYALYMRAFLFIAVVPAQLILSPAIVEALQNPRLERVGLAAKSLRLALLPAALSTSFLLVVVLLAEPIISRSDLIALTWTAAVTSVLSPLQDHLRAVFHLSGTSWKAAVLSTVQFLSIAVISYGLVGAEVNAAVIPFGGLAGANVLTLVLGLLLRGRHRRTKVQGDYRLRHLIKSGRWLLMSSLIPSGTAFLVATIVSALAGPDVLGYSEAARIVAQPILIFSLGIASVLNPRSMEAARSLDRARARRISRGMDYAMGGLGLLFLMIVGSEWALNPLPVLLPNAYAIGGLVAVTILANTVNALVRGQRAELIAARRERALANVESLSNGLRIVVAATATVTGAFAVPLGLIGTGLVRNLGFRRRIRAFYESDGEEHQAPARRAPGHTNPDAGAIE